MISVNHFSLFAIWAFRTWPSSAELPFFFFFSRVSHTWFLFITWKPCVPLCPPPLPSFSRQAFPEKPQGQTLSTKKGTGASGRYLENAEHGRRMKTQLCSFESSQSLRNAELRGRSHTHTRLCLLSLWHGKKTSRRHGKREKAQKSDERLRREWVDGWRGGGVMMAKRSKWTHRQRP